MLFHLTRKSINKKNSKFIMNEDNEVSFSSYTRANDTIKVKRKQPPKPGLKCHFCNLKYCLEEERNEHEEFWHSNKLIKS